MPYPGGKAGAGVFQRIINLMPPHQVYIEPFLGAGAVLRAKRPAALNVGIDLDPASPGLAWAAALSGRIAQNSDSRPKSPDPAMGALKNVEWRALCSDGIRFLESYRFTGEELVYCDPPYLMETRSRKRPLYTVEMGCAIEHRRFLQVCRRIPARVMISGYWSKLYADALAGWNSIQYQAMTRGGRTATEWLWFNFSPPLELHDYRYLGSNFRERERLTRKKRRWIQRLERMPSLERQALLSVLQDLDPLAGSGDARSRPSLF